MHINITAEQAQIIMAALDDFEETIGERVDSAGELDAVRNAAVAPIVEVNDIVDRSRLHLDGTVTALPLTEDEVHTLLAILDRASISTGDVQESVTARHLYEVLDADNAVRPEWWQVAKAAARAKAARHAAEVAA
jgi:hypothetical protein